MACEASTGLRGAGLAAVWSAARTVEVDRFSIVFGAPAAVAI